MGRPYQQYQLFPKASVRLPVAERKRFPRVIDCSPMLTVCRTLQSIIPGYDTIGLIGLAWVMAASRQRHCIQNCDQTAAEKYVVTIDSLYRNLPSHIQRYYCQHLTTYHLATIPHDWHSRVRNDPSTSSKFDYFRVIWLMRLSISHVLTWDRET